MVTKVQRRYTVSMYVTKFLTPREANMLGEAGVILSLFQGSKGFFNKGTYNYPGVDPSLIAEVDDELLVTHWRNMIMDYAEGKDGKSASCTWKDDYVVNITLGYIEGEDYHLCNTLIRNDKDGTRAFMRDYRYHNSKGTELLTRGVKTMYSYCDIGSPMNDTFMAYKEHYSPIEESNVYDWSSIEEIGEVTQNYAQPEAAKNVDTENWVADTYSVTFRKWTMKLYD